MLYCDKRGLNMERPFVYLCCCLPVDGSIHQSVICLDKDFNENFITWCKNSSCSVSIWKVEHFFSKKIGNFDLHSIIQVRSGPEWLIGTFGPRGPVFSHGTEWVLRVFYYRAISTSSPPADAAWHNVVFIAWLQPQKCKPHWGEWLVQF